MEDAHGAAWWLASDQGASVTGAALDPEHVLGVGGASVTLAGLTVRDHRARALDLGTGSGIQALAAGRHCDAVVATDVSERALAFARFNAALAGADVDLRRGSLLEPVRGERFDLVVSNPPFVITPRGLVASAVLPAYEYRDAGRAGDALVAELVAGVGEVLAPGGVAQLLGNWEHRAGEDWTERVGSWLDASGLDGWVVQREVLDPAQYAELWLRDGGAVRAQDPAGWDAAVTGWLADFAARGVEGVGLGFVVLRRPAGGPGMRRVEEQTGPVTGPLGDHVLAVLAAHDLLAGLDDDGLAGLRLVVAQDVTEERHLRPGRRRPAGDPAAPGRRVRPGRDGGHGAGRAGGRVRRGADRGPAGGRARGGARGGCRRAARRAVPAGRGPWWPTGSCGRWRSSVGRASGEPRAPRRCPAAAVPGGPTAASAGAARAASPRPA